MKRDLAAALRFGTQKGWAPINDPSGGSSSCDKVDDQGDEGEQKQEVYKPTCDVKYDEAENPGDQKQDKQRDKDEAHISPLAPRTVAFDARGTPTNLMTWPR